MSKSSTKNDVSSPKQSKFILILSDGTYFANDKNYDAPKFFDTVEEAKEMLENLLSDNETNEEGLEILEVISRKIARKERRVIVNLIDESL